VTPLGAAAVKMGARGLRVFPCRFRAKKPAIEDNLMLAAVDEIIIRKWWGEQGQYNIGVATGPRSGVWVLDIDGHEGERTLRQLEEKHGTLPPTVESITGDGRHLWWRWPAGAIIRNTQCRHDLPCLEWRGDGGYVLAPPSIHPSGRAYAWSVDSASEFADAPQWLIDIVTKRGGDGENDEPIGATPESWRTFIDQDHEGSHREAAIARLAGLLLRSYIIDPYTALGLCQIFNEARCHEPLARAEVFRIVDAIANLEADRRDRAEADHR
jgi:hypothetical protein